MLMLMRDVAKFGYVFDVCEIDRNDEVEALRVFGKLDCGVNPSRSSSDVR